MLKSPEKGIRMGKFDWFDGIKICGIFFEKVC